MRIMMPMSLAAAERCDACLRIGGESKGADDEAESFKARGLPVYRSIEEVPPSFKKLNHQSINIALTNVVGKGNED